MTLRNGVLVYLEQEAREDAAATIRLQKSRLLALVAGDTTSPGIDVEGDDSLSQLMSVLDPGDDNFNIVTP